MNPYTLHGHYSTVDDTRHRAICTECPWFHYDPAADKADLRAATQRHREATRLR